MSKISRDALKVMLVNKGFKLLRSGETEDRRIVSFSYPKTMKSIVDKFPSRERSGEMNAILDAINVSKFEFKEFITTKELSGFEIIKPKKFKSSDYRFSSVALTPTNVKKVRTLSEKYNLRVSKVLLYIMENN